MTATLLAAAEGGRRRDHLRHRLDSTANDATHLLHRPGLLLRSVLAMYVRGAAGGLRAGQAADAGAGSETRPAGAGGVGRRTAAAAQAAGIGDGAYIFSLVLLSSLLAIVVVPAWLSLLGPQFGVPLELAPDARGLVLAKSFLLPLAAGMLLRRLVHRPSPRAGSHA